MVIAVARIRVHLPEAHSLKGKRKVVKSMVTQVRNRYNVACSEVNYHDVWQTAEIGVCTVGNSEPMLSSVMERILRFVENSCPVDVVDSELEIIHMG